MFTANAELQFRQRLAAAFGGDADQFPHAVEIERDERVALDDAFALIGIDEARRVIAGNAEGRLRQVVGAEGKELRGFAMTWARRAARGSSIIVPVRYSSVMPVSSATSAATVSMTALT